MSLHSGRRCAAPISRCAPVSTDCWSAPSLPIRSWSVHGGACSNLARLSWLWAMFLTSIWESVIHLHMLNSIQMQPDGLSSDIYDLTGPETHQSALFFETAAEIYGRVLRHLKPRTPLPALRVLFRRYANA